MTYKNEITSPVDEHCMNEINYVCNNMFFFPVNHLQIFSQIEFHFNLSRSLAHSNYHCSSGA